MSNIATDDRVLEGDRLEDYAEFMSWYTNACQLTGLERERDHPEDKRFRWREEKMLEWHGLRRYTGRGAECPRRIVGKHCMRFREFGRPTCVCAYSEYDSYGDIYDHPEMWVDPSGNLVWTLEPYNDLNGVVQILSDPNHASFKTVQRLEELGLRVIVSRLSAWFYGTTLIKVEKNQVR